MKNYISAILTVTFIVLAACSGSTRSEKNFDRTPLLSNLVDNVIIPGYRNLSTNNGELINSIKIFNANITPENLNQIRAAWKEARLSWKAVEAFNFGPIDTRFLHTKMDVFPVSSRSIEDAVVRYDGSDKYIVRVASTGRGYGAIEYLIYAETDEKIMDSFSDGNRKSYLLALAENLKENIDVVLSDWNGKYADEFKANIGNDVSSSMSLFANALILHVEEIKNLKLETPMGLRTNSDPIPTLVESPIANFSAEFIVQNMNTVAKAFTGSEGIGLDDYLNELGIEDGNGNRLSDEIRVKIQECSALASSIDNLSDSIASKDQKVMKLRSVLKELITLLKADMMSQLGLIITFSSSDGDS